MNTTQSIKYKSGDRVRVRDRRAILLTLDTRGRLENLPFMPQMFKYCGQEFTIYKRAHKTCDTVNRTGGRSLPDTVHLDTPRCDGETYGGCQAGCLVFWKTAWLEPAAGAPAGVDPQRTNDSCTVEDVLEGTTVHGTASDADGPVYTCQATDLPKFTRLLKWWDIRQYIEDYRSGNVGLRNMLGSFCYSAYRKLLGTGIGYRLLRRFYDGWQSLRGGVPYPSQIGLIPQGERTPVEVLNLQPGELVRVKRLSEIVATLDTSNRNRGMFFDAEAVPYCDRVFRVRNRCNRIVNERSGKMLHFKTDTVILENVICAGVYSELRLFCPRAIYSMWREIWLERIAPAEPPGDASQADKTNRQQQA